MAPLRNPVFFLAWGLPAVAVLACMLTIFITVRHPDAQLPEQYHWEGFQLDRDFSRAARAAQFHVKASVAGLNGGGPCELRLRSRGPAPELLVLMLAHSSRPALDRQVTFRRVPAEPGWNDTSTLYRGECEQTPEGRWRAELVDAVNGWSIRQNVRGSLDSVTLDAIAGSGE
jgi:hypothetical protein